jgi:hypothetical protein
MRCRCCERSFQPLSGGFPQRGEQRGLGWALMMLRVGSVTRPPLLEFGKATTKHARGRGEPRCGIDRHGCQKRRSLSVSLR